MECRRTYPIGAEVLRDGVDFRVWAPHHHRVEVILEETFPFDLTSEDNGYFSGFVPYARALSLYRFRLDGGESLPDPASRYQPEGPQGPSQVIDPKQFHWTDNGWGGRALNGLVIYEMHIGTFTQDGTWLAAMQELLELAQLGINCIEVMPVADFVGEFGWGYDGVNLFAPTRLYGTPDDFRRFVNIAHALRIAVVLDVVYNHLGPVGNYMGRYSPSYFTDRHQTDWGAAINFDGEHSESVREFYLTNVAYWIQEFHLDGLRLDATQNIYDDSPPAHHILTEIGRKARQSASDRTVLLIAENEEQNTNLCRPVASGGNGLDAYWNDDFHHTAMVALTGRREAYYTDYGGSPQEFISAAKYGYLYQGQWYSWQNRERGQPGLDLPSASSIYFLQNHDQVANSGKGLRAHQETSPGRYRTLTALTLLMPGTPMIFQGQEFASSSPFLFFADLGTELDKLVQEGRQEFLRQFPRLNDSHVKANFASTSAPETFHRCKLAFDERVSHAAEYRLVKNLLRLRQSGPGFQPAASHGMDGAVIGPQAFLLRYFFPGKCDRLLVVNLGCDLELSIVPEPLIAPPEETRWRVLLSTEESQYGGSGTRSPQLESGGWHLSSESAVVLAAEYLSFEQEDEPTSLRGNEPL